MVMAVVNASQARISEMSWIKLFVLAESADAERSWLSLACKLGCVETWTLDGRDMVSKVWFALQQRDLSTELFKGDF